MIGHIHTFIEERHKLDEKINQYIDKYREENFINLQPIHTSQENIKGYAYLMIPNRIRAIVSFNCEKCNGEEIKDIKKALELAEQSYDKIYPFVIRKSFIDDSIVFWFNGRYYDINNIFDIKKSNDNDDKRILIKLKQDWNICNSELVYFTTNFQGRDLDIFLYKNVYPKLQELL